MAFDLDQLLRDADPARDLVIPEPDPASARTAVRQLPPRRRRPPLDLLAPGLAVLAVIAVVAVVISVVAHHSQPPSTPPNGAAISPADRHVEMRYADGALRQGQQLAVCQTKPPNTLNGAPPRSLIANLSAIRHPGPALTLPSLLQRNVHSLYVHHSRLVLRQNGNDYWLVTVAETGRNSLLTPRCQTATIHALKRELPQIPGRLRAPTMQLLRRQLRILSQFSSPAVCLLVQYPAADADSCTANTRQINGHGLVTYYGQLNGVVPNGVASVTIRYHDPQTNAPRTITAPVTNNVFATNISPNISPNTLGRGADAENPMITWTAADGSTLKTINAGGSVSGGFCGGRNTHVKTNGNPCR